jgi:hypothetical protein
MDIVDHAALMRTYDEVSQLLENKSIRLQTKRPKGGHGGGMAWHGMASTILSSGGIVRQR